MPLLAQAQKLIVVLVLIVAVLALVIGVFIGHGLQIVPIDTTPHYLTQYGWTGCGMNAGGNVLDAQQYVTSYDPNGYSEKVVIQGGYMPTAFNLAVISEYRWRIFLTRDGLSWNEVTGSPFVYPIPGTSFVSGCTVKAAPVYQVLGPYTGGVKVQLDAHVYDAGVLDKGFLEVSEQAANLVSGIGKLNADAQGTVGTAIHATATVGYVSSAKDPSKGWDVYAFSTAQNRVVMGPSTVTQLEQTFSYTLTPADFSTASGCGNGNRIEWHLRNELWQKDFTFTTVVDVSALAPSFAFDGYTGAAVSNGTITLQFHSTPNPTTQYTISRVIVAYGFGGISNFVNLTGKDTNTTIPLGSNGNLHIEGYSMDSACRPSPSQRMDINVLRQGSGQSGTKPNWLIIAVIMAAFIASGAVVAYVAKGPLWSRALLLSVFVLAGVLVTLLVQPQLLNATGAVIAGGWWRWR